MNELVKINAVTGPPVQELVVISGKGGTGKTSVVASFAVYREPLWWPTVMWTRRIYT